VLVPLVLAGPLGGGSAWASTLPAEQAVVVALTASPPDVPAAGASVTVTATVEHATSCQLELLSSQSFPVVYSHNPKACSSGTYSAKVTIGPSSSAVARTVALALVARNDTSAFTYRFYEVLAAALPALVASVSASPSDVPAAGASVTVTATVEHATSCQLELLSSQSFPVAYSHNPRPCATGDYSATVTIGPNPSSVQRTVAFALVARNDTSAFAGRFYVLLAAGPRSSASVPSTPSAPAVPGTTAQPPSSSTGPLVANVSSNWAGYAVTAGPYSVVKGTFTVPSLVSALPSFGGGQRPEQVSEWVGLDGMSSSDASLIQAGVDEYPDPANPAVVDIQPWWEILPAAETNITSVAVSVGDKVTVTIWKLGAATWRINLTDDTDGQSFTTPPEHYTGPGVSAEWIVEATSECQLESSECRTAKLAPYSPQVTFSALGMTGPPATTLQAISMMQGAQQVATPSALSSDGFSVSYTGMELIFAGKGPGVAHAPPRAVAGPVAASPAEEAPGVGSAAPTLRLRQAAQARPTT